MAIDKVYILNPTSNNSFLIKVHNVQTIIYITKNK